MTQTDKVWPVHLKPLDDEMLSSWLIRLAHAHGLKVMTLATILFGYRRPVWDRDIDRLAPSDVLDKVSAITGTPLERVMETTLRSLEGRAFEKFNLTGNTRWILPLGIYGRRRKSYGLQFCPECLRGDAIAYFRRSWRLGFITVCTRHGRVLRDDCPSCGAPIAPHRVDMKSRTLYPRDRDRLKCPHCGSSLLDRNKVIPADQKVVAYQRQWEAALRTGWIDWDGNPSMYAHLFFEGLRAMCSGLIVRKDLNRLEGRLEGLKETALRIPVTGIEFARTHDRYHLLKSVVALLDEWPCQFEEAFKHSHLRYSSLREYTTVSPYWYESVIHKEMKNTYAPISKREVEAIIDVVESRFGRFTTSLARKVAGRDISEEVRNYVSPPVSSDTYELLLASIDHEIAGTQDKDKRNELLRDKVMFAAGRSLKLSLGKLSMITISDVRKLVPQSVTPRFFEGPMNPEQGRAWCEWYFEKVRPWLKPSNKEETLFISSRTQSGMGESNIGRLFKRAVKHAGLDREIKDYTSYMSVV